MSLAVQSRDLTKEKPKALRREGFLPGEIYGPGQENIHVKVSLRDFEKVYQRAGSTDLVDLQIDGSTYNVLIHDVEQASGGQIISVNFLKVNMNKVVTLKIPFNFIGESELVAKGLGVLSTIADDVEIECLPSALVHSIDVDLSKLENFGDQITMADLKLPPNVKLLAGLGEVVVSMNEINIVVDAETPVVKDETVEPVPNTKQEVKK